MRRTLSYYDYFPLFTGLELRKRFQRLSFERATLLGLRNIVSAAADYPGSAELRSFVEKSTDEQSEALCGVLISVGIAPDAAVALQKVQRHLFAQQTNRPYAYLNASIPLTNGTWLTAPGLVALMLERLELASALDIVELGSGSGFHLACVQRLVDVRARMLGVELDNAICERASRMLQTTGVGRPPEIVCCDARDFVLPAASVDRVFVTMSLRHPFDLPVLRSLRDGGIAQFVRPLNKMEFEELPDWSSTKTEYGDHSTYLANDGWRRLGCLGTYRQTNGYLQEIDALLDVRFVPAMGTIDSSEPPGDYFIECDLILGRSPGRTTRSELRSPRASTPKEAR